LSTQQEVRLAVVLSECITTTENVSTFSFFILFSFAGMYLVGQPVNINNSRPVYIEAGSQLVEIILSAPCHD